MIHRTIALLCLLSAGAAPLAAAPVTARDGVPAKTILFIGNSFTYGALSPVWKYRADSVTNLNHDGAGGVPALFKLLTEEAGLNYDVSLETSGGKTLKWHWDNRKDAVDRAWDHVVLQDLSVLDAARPGDSTNLVTYAGHFARLFAARNAKVDISLTATWSRPDQTFPTDGHWHGRPITAMALDLRRAYDKAAAASPAIDRVNPVGEAFNCAIAAGVADPDPYDGIGFGKVDLWAYDHYHASAFGYYLEALTVFTEVTGKDPRTFGADEQAAGELGISPHDAVRLQRVAWATTHGGACDASGIGAASDR
jgi:hypothetical protein